MSLCSRSFSVCTRIVPTPSTSTESYFRSHVFSRASLLSISLIVVLVFDVVPLLGHQLTPHTLWDFRRLAHFWIPAEITPYSFLHSNQLFAGHCSDKVNRSTAPLSDVPYLLAVDANVILVVLNLTAAG